MTLTQAPRPQRRSPQYMSGLLDRVGRLFFRSSSLPASVRQEIVVLTIAATVALGSLTVLLLLFLPRITNTMYVRDNAAPVAFSFPLTVDTGTQQTFFDVTFAINIPLLAPGRFTAYVDDCLESISVNGAVAGQGIVPFCDLTKGRTLEIGPLLHRGENMVRMRMKNAGGPALLQFNVSWSDPLLLGGGLLIIFVLGGYICALFYLLRSSKEAFAMAGIFGAGVLLRAYYTLATPFWIRGHDANGHLEYIRYMATHWSIPAAKDGWEFYHPPLYYFIGSLFQRVSVFLSGDPSVIGWLQFYAFVLCVGTLALCIPIARQLFTSRDDGHLRLLFVAVIATLPGVVFFAPRINNDVLAQFLAFATFFFILRWWRHGGIWSWYGTLLMIALHILTKSTGYLLLPLPFVCLLWKHGWTWRKRIHHGIIGLFLLVLLSGGVAAYRYLEADKQTDRFVIGNIGNLNAGLRVPNIPSAYLVFNPIEVVRHPYNNAWLDTERRQFFWEYFYRSAFFGEFNMGNDARLLAKYMVLLPMLLLPLAIAGLVVMLRRMREHLPILLGFGALLAGHTLLRLTSPFSCVQDFRYSLAILIPVLAFVLYGMRLLPPVVRRIPTFIIVLSVSLSVMFLLAI